MGACQSTSVEIVESRGRGYSLASPQSIREADLIYSAGPLTREEIFSRIESSRENIDFSTGDHTFLGAYLTQRGYYPDDMEKENQDSYSFHNKFGKDTGTSFFAVYDGHGKDGHLVSQYTRKYLPKDIHKVGLDKDRLYLERAEIRNPTGKFKLGNLNDYKLFNFQEFTHINCMTDTLISNTLEDIDLIIGNFKYWLKKNGVLTIHIYDNIDKLDPAPRNFSMMYDNENDKLKHALTYFTKFTHDAVFKNLGEHVYEYVEKYIVKSGNSINKNTKYNILPKDKLIKKFIDNDFILYKKSDLSEFDIDDYSLYFFKKNI